MKCKIRDKDGIYLSPWLGQYTRDPEKAGCWSEKSAQNILHSSLPDVSGREWQMIPADETTADDIHPEASISLSEHAKELFDMMALDDNLPSEENELPADIDDFLKAGYARFLKQQKLRAHKNTPHIEDNPSR